MIVTPTTSREWLLASLSKAKAADLLRLQNQAADAGYCPDGPTGKTMKTRRAWIEAARRMYWDSNHSKGTSLKADLCDIPASEINDWLRTLPPVPPYPKQCQCAQCRLTRASSTCRRCGAEMRPGIALTRMLIAGTPDFHDSDVVTLSPGGPGAAIDCMKCAACGWSVTEKGD